DIEHQKSIDGLNQACVIKIGGEQFGVTGFHSTIAAYIQIPAVFRGNDADVLALRFCAFTCASGYRHLQLVRCAKAPVTFLKADRHAYRVLDSKAAPRAAYTRLRRPQSLAIGVTRFETGIHQFLPDHRQLLQTSAE